MSCYDARECGSIAVNPMLDWYSDGYTVWSWRLVTLSDHDKGLRWKQYRL